MARSGCRAARPPGAGATWCSMRSDENSSNASRRLAASSGLSVPGLPGRLQARARGRRAHAGDEAAPARQRLDGHEPAALDVEHPPRSPLEWSTRLRRKPVGGRSATAAAASLRSMSFAVRSMGERACEAIRRRRGPPDRIALHHHRQEHQAAVAVRLLDPGRGRVLPLLDRAREERVRRDHRCSCQAGKPHARRPSSTCSASADHRPPQLHVVVRALPGQRAVHVGARVRLEARRSCRSPATCRAPGDARAPRARTRSACA